MMSKLFKKRAWTQYASAFLLLACLAPQGPVIAQSTKGRKVTIIDTTKKGTNGTVQGTILGTDGLPLIGVAVQNRAEQKGAVTDVNGYFSLPIKSDEVTLQITYVGKKSMTIKAKNGTVLKLTMEDDAKMMSDVVITGYQSIDRRHLTSAITSVSMDDIQIPGVTDLNHMLEGKIPDMVVTSNSGEVNATPRLRIRGTSTIIGNREPLWVVDGIIVSDPVNLSPDVLNDPDYVNRIGNAISGINPQDIERLDVLKDAAATALYGTRAANGVIVITTKKGRVGKPVVSYSATGTVRQRPRYTDRKINLMNSKERIQFSQDLVSKHYLYPSDMPVVGYEAALQKLYNGTYTQDDFQSEVASMETMNTDWFDILCKDSFSQDHNFNISGGSDKVRYYASAGYSNQDDVIKGNTNQRYTGTAKIDMIFSEKAQLQFSINGYLNDRKYNQSSLNPINFAYNESRAIPAYNEDGSYSYYKKYTGVTNYTYMDYSILNELDNSYQKQSTSGVTATANFRYNATDWLFLNAVLSGTTTNANLEGYWGEKTFYASKLRKCEYGDTPPSNSSMPYGGELSTTNSKNKSYTARIQANINKYFGADKQHNINIALGGEANSNRYESYSKTERGYYLNRGKKFVSDISSSYTTYVNWLLSNVPTVTDSRTNLLSAYATASYSYGDLFTVNANTRYDGSNKFGSRSNEKLLPVWSVSGMVNLKSLFDKEDKFTALDAFNLKLSYGEQGNMLDGQTPVLVIKKGSVDGYYDELYSKVDRFANPDLKWEKTHSSNLGFESSWFKSRLTLGVEFYYKKTTDAFMDKTISTVNGYDSYVVNSGTVTNQGYNINITAVPVKNKDFNWIFSGSLSKIKNTMKTAPGQDTYELSNFLNGTAVVQGESLETFYSYRFLGLNPANGGPIFDDWEDHLSDLTDLGKYETYTQVLVASGKRTPDTTGSINNTFTYKAWRLNIGMYYSLGAKTRLFRLFDDFVNGYSSEMNINRDLLNAWKKPGDELLTNIPAIMGRSSDGYYDYAYHWSTASNYTGVTIAENSWDMYDYSDIRVVSADYLKLSSVSLTYEVPKRILGVYKLNRLAVTLGATNLYTFCNSKLKGQTPTQGGFTEVQLSDTPTYTIGLNLEF
jgi:TonB-linked SusC/RagA family outer membrane protein